MRWLLEERATRLDALRRDRAHTANAGRLRDVGELEARRAQALATPLCIVVYRMHRPRMVTPPSEVALVCSVLDGAAVLSEEYGEIVALVPGASATGLRERAALPFAAGRVAVEDLAPGESFTDLLSRARGALG
jgi:hypothetical protein